MVGVCTLLLAQYISLAVGVELYIMYHSCEVASSVNPVDLPNHQ